MRIHFLICASFMLLVSADETQKRSPAGETAQASYGVSPGQYVIRTAGPGEESPQLAPGQYLDLLQTLLTQQQGAPPSQAQQHIIRQLLVARDQNPPAAVQYQPQVQLNTQARAQAEAASLLQQQTQVQNRPDRRPMPTSALLQRALQQTYYNDLHARPRPPARFAAYPQAQPPQQLQQQNAAGAFQYIVPQVQLPTVQPLSSSTPASSAQQPLQGQQHVQLVERLQTLQEQRAEEEAEVQRGAAVEQAQRAASEEARRAAAAEEARIAAQQHAAAQQRAAAAAQRKAEQQRVAAAEQEAAQQRAAAAQREAAQQRAVAAQREAAQQRAAASQREAIQQQRAAAAQREAAALRQREELQAQKARELQAQQLLATYEDEDPEELPVEYSDDPAPIVYQRPVSIPTTTPPAPRPIARTRRPPSVPVVEQYLRETTNPEIARNPRPQATNPAPKSRQQSRPLARPIYVPAAQPPVSEISQEDQEDVLASLLPGSSPSTPRSSIFVTNKIPIKNSRQGGITIEEVPLDEGPETTQVKTKSVPVVRIPTPEGQRPLTQTELQALIDSGFIVTPVDEVPVSPKRQSIPNRPRPQSQNIRQQIPGQQINQVVYDEPPQLSPIIVPEQLPKRRIRPQQKQQIQVEVPEELRPIPSPRPGFIVRYEEEDTDNSASTTAPRLRAEYGSKTRRQRTRRPVRPPVEQDER